jgi:dTDP-4-dehydrorhamnose reductase
MILLLGGSGYVGSAFQEFFQRQKVNFVSLARSECDYTSVPILIKAIQKHKPTFLINAAGFTGKPNVDACERQKAECLAGNAVLPGSIREACETTELPWGHVSTGCIYNGPRLGGGGYKETDPPNFCFRSGVCSFYSGCKALGEEILHSARQVFIWRMRIPFSKTDSPRNYLSKLLRYEKLLEAENSLTELDEFVEACWKTWDQRVPFGTYHMTNPGSVTTSQVVELISRETNAVIRSAYQRSNRSSVPYFRDEREFMATVAKTPRSNCVLDTTKLALTGIQLTDVREALTLALRNWQTPFPDSL